MRLLTRLSRPLLAPCALLTFAIPLRAQAPDSSASPSPWHTAVTLGSWAEDRLRLGQLMGEEGTEGFLLRTASTTPPREGRRLMAVLPEGRMVWNSDIPFSLNQGGMFAARGVNLRVAAGVRAEAGIFSASFVPVLIAEQNLRFQIIPYSADLARSAFSSPWHWGIESADLPLRFGARPRTRFGLGESTVAVRARGVRVGASTESQWWGPGIRNSLVMSNNAGGFPHLFLATAKPLRTPVGEVEARWIVGRLAESAYFDTVANNQRSLAGIVATLRPAFDPGLTVGFARTVYGPAGSPLRAFDILRGVGHPNVTPELNSPAAPSTGRDQIVSVFGRWVFPAAGAEVYGEVARTDAPSSLRDLLVEPQRSQGYTVGAQWVHRTRGDALLRVQGEATTLEQTDRNGKHVASFYASRAVSQGYTHRGQVLGAAIGPGASSQWAAADFIRPRWRAGALAGRIRWENDILYRLGLFPTFHAHDVTAMAGVRGGYRIGGMEVGAELILARRANYLFQNRSTGFNDIEAIDIVNRTFTLSVSPAARPRPRPAAPAPATPPPPPADSARTGAGLP